MWLLCITWQGSQNAKEDRQAVCPARGEDQVCPTHTEDQSDLIKIHEDHRFEVLLSSTSSITLFESFLQH